MQAISEKGATRPKLFERQVIVNFCRTVLRRDDEVLQRAMQQYRQTLAQATQPR